MSMRRLEILYYSWFSEGDLQLNQSQLSFLFKLVCRTFHCWRGVTKCHIIPTTTESSEEVLNSQLFLDLKTLCQWNSDSFSACLLQKPETDLNKVVGYCDQILQVAPSNDKAFFRKAQALFRLNDVSGALASCLEAAKLLNTTGLYSLPKPIIHDFSN